MRSAFSLVLPLVGRAGTLLVAAATLIGAAPPAHLWLDTPVPYTWNQPGAPIVAAPPWSDDGKRVAGRRDPELLPGGRCAAEIHRPVTSSERAVVAKGWFIFSPGGSSMIATKGPHWSIVMGTSDADGMCRPIAFQVFVFVDGRFAGTISPTLMASRTDGSFSTLAAAGRSELRADFTRYADADALCCPHAITHVRYGMRMVRGRPILVPTSAVTTPAS